ncbi:hypothetical protein [Cellulomonas sp. URHD0024]|uniref:hypothetical protein n=1 Tax=Cellulomonas sp. URHD0024 TaxID=1302620 RepID=UPI000482B64A|nr:hypothetical protein [Cellulomonas sp. URHD0024]
MPTPATRSHAVPVRRRPFVVLVLLLLLLPAAAVLLGAAATQGTPAGAVQGAASDEPLPQTTNYDDRVGGPHQDTPEEETGRAVTPVRLALIATVVVVTAGIVTTLAVRARRRRRAAEGDLS